MKKISALICFLCLALEVICQTPIPPVPQTTTQVTNNGFILKEEVSVTTVYSGVSFTYTIDYTTPPNVSGTTTITITDVIPYPLIVEAATSSNMTVTTSAGGVTTVTYTIPATSSPTQTVGAFTVQINVHFPHGTTCNGLPVSNKACIKTTGQSGTLITFPDPGLCTDYLTVTAVAFANIYDITKSSTLPHTGTGSSLVYHGAVDNPVTYNLNLRLKGPLTNTNTYVGLQDQYDIWITDVIPIDADYVPGSLICTWGSASIQTVTTTVVGSEKHVKFKIQYLSIYSYSVSFSLKIYYPGSNFPVGTTVINTATYTSTSCSTAVTGNTSSVTVQFDAVSPGGTASKEVHITNPVPGCVGFYRLLVTNTGNVGLCTSTVVDQIPSQVTVTSIVFNTAYYNYNPMTCTLYATGSGGNATVTVPALTSGYYTWTPPSALGTVNNIQVDISPGLPTNSVYGIDINFIVNNGLLVGLPVTNTMTLSFPFCTPPASTSTSTVTFVIEDYQPKICAVKLICNEQPSYSFGNTVRYRLRIQNIGSGFLTGAKIRDVLDENLQYAGNESYYYSTNGDITCAPNGAPAWTGVMTATTATNTLEYILPPIAPNCQYQNWLYVCNPPNVPYYFIEFDVTVKQYALAGSLANFFTVSGGTLPSTVTSTVEYITVNSQFGALPEKRISVDNRNTWSQSASITSSTTDVWYRLKYTNTANYPVRDIVFIDLLPMSCSPTTDGKILDRPADRGSQFELKYSTSVNSPLPTLPIIMKNYIAFPATPTITVDDTYNICLPEMGYSPSPCNNPSWGSSGIGRNVKLEFGPNFSLQPGDVLTCDYKVSLPSVQPVGFHACNSFALKSTGYYYIMQTNGTYIQQIVNPTPAESEAACITSWIGSIGNITGKKFNDLNGNGVMDANEPGLQNWVISLGGAATSSTTTDNNGNFGFSNLIPGNYLVSEVKQDCWNQTFPAIPSTYSITIANGQTVTNVLFGNIEDGPCVDPPLGMIAWWPLDGAGTTISNNLLDIIGNHTGTTPCNLPDDAGGKVEGACRFNRDNMGVIRVPNDPFSEVGDGDFTIDAWIKSENLPTICQFMTNHCDHSIIMDNRVTNYYGYNPPEWLRPGLTFYVKNEQWNSTTNRWEKMRLGLVLKDNVSNYWDPATEFLSNQVTLLMNQWQHVAVTVSRNGNGIFYLNGSPIGTFTPIPGTFVDNVVTPSLLDIGHSSRLNCGSCGFANDYFNGLLDEIEIFTRPLSPTEIMSLVNAGCAGKCKDVENGSILGKKFNDLNGNGIMDANEPGLPNWTLNLAGSGTGSTTTDSDGNFSFSNLLPGTYTVSEVLQACWHQTAPSTPGTYTITLAIGQTVTNVIFGNQSDNCSVTVISEPTGVMVAYNSSSVLPPAPTSGTYSTPFNLQFCLTLPPWPQLTLNAPLLSGTNQFIEWQINGTFYSSSNVITVPVDPPCPKVYKAVYCPLANICQDFDPPNSVIGNWQSHNTLGSVATHTTTGLSITPNGNHGTPGLRAKDQSGATYIFNDVDFNVDLKALGNCNCLFYDIYPDDNSGHKAVPACIYIYSGFNPNLPIDFIINPQYTARFCPPTSLAFQTWGEYQALINDCIGGNLPVGLNGSWKVIAGGTWSNSGTLACNNWDILRQNLDGVMFYLDINPVPSEVFFYDNICIKPCVPNTCTVTVGISASANPACSGTNVSFTATPVNGGTSPAYQWKVNGTNAGTNTSTYSYIPFNGDVVQCALTSNATCTTILTATSNTVTMTVYPLPTAAISGTVSVCVGSPSPGIMFQGANGTNPYTFNYNISGGSNQTVTTSSGNSVTVSQTTSVSGNFFYSLVSVTDAYGCTQSATGSATVYVVDCSCSNPCPGIATVTYGGQTYHTVQVGTQCWFQENLNIGTMIPGGQNQTNTTSIEKYCYADVATNCAVYGGLYQWNNLMQWTTYPGTKGICPQGWHIPTDPEWTTLINYLGSSSVAGGELKEAGTIHWSTNIGGTNSSCFTGLPGGEWYVSPSGFYWLNQIGVFYSSTQYSNAYASAVTLYDNNTSAGMGSGIKAYGFSVRCILGTPAGCTVTINIGVSGNPVCSGTNVTFTATTTYEGTNPVFQWKINGLNVGTSTPTYSYVPANGDVVQCVLTSNATCATITTAYSNLVTMTVYSLPTAAISGSASVCVGSPSPGITFQGANGTAPFTFTYKINGGSDQTITTLLGNSVTASQTTAVAGTFVYSLVSVTDAHGCTQGSSGSATITVFPCYCPNPCPGIPTVTYGNQNYNTVLIGTQCWLNENLNIGATTTGTVNQTNNNIIEKWCYADDNANCSIYGGLYQWGEVVQYLNGASNTTSWGTPPTGFVQGICPPGWHLPTDAEFTTLYTFLGGSSIAGGKMKETGYVHWLSPNAGATNSSCFTALPTGDSRFGNGTYQALNAMTTYWTATELIGNPSIGARGIYLVYNNGATSWTNTSKIGGYSARCIYDASSACTVTVSIGASVNPVCAGTNVTIIAAATNGGTSPVYQWKVNTSNVGTNTTTYTYIPTNGDIIQCVLTSNASCAIVTTAYSNQITMTVYPMPTAGISGTVSVCVGSPSPAVTFQGANGTQPYAFSYKINGGSNQMVMTTSGNSVTVSQTTAVVGTFVYSLVSVMDINGCSQPASGSATITVVACPCSNPCPGIPTVTYGNQTYNTIQIGSQCWFKENLNIGTMIPGGQNQTNTVNITKYCYGDITTNCTVYGGLYQWDNMMQWSATPGTQGICPPGWHLPTEAEWCQLYTFLDATVNCVSGTWLGTDVGGKLKSTELWMYPNTGATNSSCFTALPGGHINDNGAFIGKTNVGYFWSSTVISTISPPSSRICDLWGVSAQVAHAVTPQSWGCSVRCIFGASIPCPATITITVSVNPVCIGTPVTYTAVTTNGGTIPAFQWKVNGMNVGTSTSTYTYNPANGDVVQCVLTSNASCVSITTVYSNLITMIVNPSPVPTITGPTSVCSGSTGNVYTTQPGMTGYIWTVSAGGTITAGSGSNAITVAWSTTGAKIITVNYTNSNGCFATVPSSYNVTVNPAPTPTISGSATVYVGTTGVVYTTQAGMTNYIWTVSAGGTITAGGTSTSNMVTVTWNTVGANAITVNYTNANGCNATSPTIFPVTVNPLVPVQLTLENVTVGSGQTKCYNATQTIFVAGSGTIFIVQDGGSATMIAGQNILYQPVTTVYNGGYMLGYIAPSGPYCLMPSMPAVITGEQEVPPMTSEKSFFKIYPNPTTGNFILELTGESPVDKVTVDVYGMWGEKVMTATLNGERKHEFSLSDRPIGVYFIRVISGEKAETVKIIKQ